MERTEEMTRASGPAQSLDGSYIDWAAVVGGGPTYFSFDIDALDPAFAPGTGTPEIGGLASWQMQASAQRR